MSDLGLHGAIFPLGAPALPVDRVAEIAHAAELEALASGFAHRLSQPLGAIAAFAQAGSRVLSRPQPMLEQANAILAEIGRLALEAGADIRRMRLQYMLEEPAARRRGFAELVGEIEPLLTRIAVRFGGAVACTLEPGLPEVHADPTRIQYVLLSFVRNAFDAAEPGGEPPLVRISATRDRESVLVDVVDTGPGVGEGSEPEIFHPFLATRIRGVGLSLATSRSIVEAHQGTIGFERLQSGANRFWFRLPAALA